MIVLATHGYTGLKHAWFGSTAERVVRHAPCPVLIVRELNRKPYENELVQWLGVNSSTVLSAVAWFEWGRITPHWRKPPFSQTLKSRKKQNAV